MIGSWRSNRPTSTTLFRDNQNILRYRYLAQNPGPNNPDGLPVGFVAGQGTGRTWLGMTCAACHTAEIRLGVKAYRVDGGPTGGDVQAFLTDLTLLCNRPRPTRRNSGGSPPRFSGLQKYFRKPARAQGPAWAR